MICTIYDIDKVKQKSQTKAYQFRKNQSHT